MHGEYLRNSLGLQGTVFAFRSGGAPVHSSGYTSSLA